MLLYLCRVDVGPCGGHPGAHGYTSYLLIHFAAKLLITTAALRKINKQITVKNLVSVRTKQSSAKLSK